MNIQHIKTTWKLCHSILSRERFASNKQFNFLLKKKRQSKRPSRSPEREKMRDSRIFIYLFILLALPTTKARIFIVLRFIIEYISLRDFIGP